MAGAVAEHAMRLLFRFLDDRRTGRVDAAQLRAFASTMKLASANGDDPEEAAAVLALCAALHHAADAQGGDGFSAEAFVRVAPRVEKAVGSFASVAQAETAGHVLMNILDMDPNSESLQGLRAVYEEELEGGDDVNIAE